eukprot:TRINITY_DN2907_c0_g1_i10.p1 TRINITY_DN2907_c0_g1~~TRINITY_DN2907_c0_g1_i10.p1  ORF type:complete len:144 (+),score=18.41 TRINITY_DN2907_c0_g1_i10:82-513(+)
MSSPSVVPARIAGNDNDALLIGLIIGISAIACCVCLLLALYLLLRRRSKTREESGTHSAKTVDTQNTVSESVAAPPFNHPKTWYIGRSYDDNTNLESLDNDSFENTTGDDDRSPGRSQSVEELDHYDDDYPSEDLEHTDPRRT